MDTRAFGPKAQGDLASGEGVDPRYATARDAAMQSFFNRFGRSPTDEEFRQSIGHFLPAGVARPMGENMSGAAHASRLKERSAGPNDMRGLTSQRVAGAGGSGTPDSAELQPQQSRQFACEFGEGRYEGWARVVLQDTASANFRRNTGDTRPAFLTKPPIIVEIEGKYGRAGQMPRPLSLQMAVDDRAGQATNRGLGLGTLEGPGIVEVRATNRGPFTVHVTLGVWAI